MNKYSYLNTFYDEDVDDIGVDELRILTPYPVCDVYDMLGGDAFKDSPVNSHNDFVKIDDVQNKTHYLVIEGALVLDKPLSEDDFKILCGVYPNGSFGSSPNYICFFEEGYSETDVMAIHPNEDVMIWRAKVYRRIGEQDVLNCMNAFRRLVESIYDLGYSCDGAFHCYILTNEDIGGSVLYPYLMAVHESEVRFEMGFYDTEYNVVRMAYHELLRQVFMPRELMCKFCGVAYDHSKFARIFKLSLAMVQRYVESAELTTNVTLDDTFRTLVSEMYHDMQAVNEPLDYLVYVGNETDLLNIQVPKGLINYEYMFFSHPSDEARLIIPSRDERIANVSTVNDSFTPKDEI